MINLLQPTTGKGCNDTNPFLGGGENTISVIY